MVCMFPFASSRISCGNEFSMRNKAAWLPSGKSRRLCSIVKMSAISVVRRLTSQNQLPDLSTTEVTEPFGAVTSQIGGPKAVPSNANFARCGAKGRGRARRPSKVSCPEVRNPNLQRSELFGQGRATFSIEKSCSICILFQAVNGKIMKEDIRMHGNMVMVYEVPMWRYTKCLERWGDKLWQMEPVATPSENPADFPDRLRSWETPHGRTMILEISGNLKHVTMAATMLLWMPFFWKGYFSQEVLRMKWM